MKSAHAGMQITHEEFMALAADLSASLDKFNVPAKEKGELMAIARVKRMMRSWRRSEPIWKWRD